jgi:hypothetical protein
VYWVLAGFCCFFLVLAFLDLDLALGDEIVFLRSFDAQFPNSRGSCLTFGLERNYYEAL